MTLSMIGKRILAAVSIVGAALTVASCGPGNTVDFVYVTSNKQNPGQVNAYILDSLTGGLVQILDSPYPSGGRNPVYDVTSPDGKYLYVANHDDNTLVMFAIGKDGKLYPLQTVNTPGTEPVALAISADGSTLYALDYYAPAAPGQPPFTDLNPGPGAVVAFPIDTATGRLGTALSIGATNYWPVQCFPTNLAVTPDGSYLYVTNTNAVLVTTSPPVTGTVPTRPASCPASGTISEFAVGASGAAALTELSGSPFSTGAGSEPTGIVADPSSGAVYVTDAVLNQLYAYTVQSGGSLTLASTTATGTEPMGAAVASSTSGAFLYVTNYTDGTISSYSLGSGAPKPIATTNAGSSGPLCIIVDPELQRFIYTSDYIGGTVGGAELNPSSGTLILNQGSPYVSSGQPTCVAAVSHPHGKHNGV